MNLDGRFGDYPGVETVGRDALLVLKAQLGDRRALGVLVGHWHEPLWRYVRRMLAEAGAADDVSQEAWAGVLKALPGLREPERFAPWLFTIARRSVLNRLKDAYRPEDLAEPDQTVDDHVDDHATAVLDRTQVVEGLAGLPVPEREVLVLFYLHDLPVQDCAQVLQVPVGTVKSRLSRARRLLRRHLTDRGYTS